MATQCRSSKCTAERKGFRRELDSWRHKLIHCVGFESILEGIYGPRLLHDLNIFDDCEPDYVADWSIDARCSFCNLHLEKLSDHVPTVPSPGSPPPAETPPPQGLSTSEKLQCQAGRFLHAVFCKKEFPESCDPSIPLAAQELMRRMIRQFAVEFAYRSRPRLGRDNLSPVSEDPPKPADPDGPLDLRVGRPADCPPQEGVLDLSKKTAPSLQVHTVNSHQKGSGSLGPVDEDPCRQGGDAEASEDSRGTVLEGVLSSLCPYHRLLLHRILQDMREDHRESAALRDAHRRLSKAEPHCCHTGRKPPDDPTCPVGSFTAAPCAVRLTTCKLRTCALASVCICMKTIASMSCQNVAVGCVGKVVCSSCTVCFAHQKHLACQHQHNGDDAYETHACKRLRVPVVHAPVHHPCEDACAGCRSPSPPPLSPVPVDADCRTSEKNVSGRGEERRTPPPLLPHRRDPADKAQLAVIVPAATACPPAVKEAPTPETHTTADGAEDQCGSLIGEFMDKFTEKLQAIQPSEKEHSPSSHVVQDSKTCDDTHLTEIITTVLHNSSNKEYDLKELFEQHVTTEQRSPQTRSRRRHKVLASVGKSRPVPASRKELAKFPSPVCRKKLVHKRRKHPKNVKAHLPSPWSGTEQSRIPEQIFKTEDLVAMQDPSDRLNYTSDSPPHVCKVTSESISQEEEEKTLQTANHREPSPPNKTDLLQSSIRKRKTIQQRERKTCKRNDKFGRSKRNIVPPQRFSSYVTEPRKMYYAACFSESIFLRRSPKVNGATKPASEGGFHTSFETDTEHPSKTEAQDHMLDLQKQEKNTCTVSPEQMTKGQIDGNSGLKRSPRIREKSSENSTSPSKISMCCGMESQSPELTLSHSVDTRKSSIKYSSPVKLMLLSPVKGEDGVKYTLTAADCGSCSHREMFDPCVEASWAGNAVNDLGRYLQTGSTQTAESENTSSKNAKEAQSCDEADLESHANTGESFTATHETTPVKRRPGRPKKLGPHIEKAVKRPIGRPPKPKAGDPSGLNGKNVVSQKANEISSEKAANKNLKITIMYGRSRKARRVVSEDLKHLSTDQCVYEGDSNGLNKTCSRWLNNGGDSALAAKDQLEDLNFVTPCLEDKKGITHSSSNIKCQKLNDMAVTRKPGRPPKVKISGISVTVTTVSPRQRKIHIKRDEKESPLHRRALIMECDASKEQKTINQRSDGILRTGVDVMKQNTDHSTACFAPVRHSVRERKPSIHLLHSVATARSFSRSNALVQRSHKLLMSNVKTRHLTQRGSKLATNNALSGKRSTNGCMQDVVRFSGVSVDSIFASDESPKWWPVSASSETLNEELDRRMRLMSDTWVSDGVEASTSDEGKTRPCERITCSAERSSAVKMLFEKNYNMEKLCSWFMQTTETQSLAIVKKVSARNPYEVFHYNPIRTTCSMNVCRSPQAERLRKHVKKFAKVVPKSPEMYQQAQAQMYNTRRSLSKIYPFTTSKAVFIPGTKQKISRSHGTWHVYRTALLRARTKFKTRAKTSKVEDKVHKNQIGCSIQKPSVLKELLTSLSEEQDTSKFTERNSIEVKTSKKTMDAAALSREERISSKAWSPETLKECRVFLKKINSPNTKLMTEECNICTVKFNISPAGCDIAMEQEEKTTSEVKFEKTCSSSRKTPSSTMNESTVTNLGSKRGSCSRGESPPAKLARQSRSSRGVLGARWCDFVLGPSK